MSPVSPVFHTEVTLSIGLTNVLRVVLKYFEFIPTLELHSKAASNVGIVLLFQWSQHRKQFQRKADNEKKLESVFRVIQHILK